MKVNYSFQKAARERAKQEKKEAKKRDAEQARTVSEEQPVAVEAPQSEPVAKP